MPDPNSYDELPYSAKAFYDTHPDHLAAVSMFYGLNPPAVDRCRVLELGCANGANLLPMAMALPDSQFVGVDLSARQVNDGLEMLERLELKNVQLRAMSILDLDESFGEFDYILCHGVYSWVPPEVQNKILQIASENLAPNGLAYISYNTYPGWHIRGIVREMLNYHVRKSTQLTERAQRAKSFFDFLVSSLPNANTAYARLLQDEAELLGGSDMSYLAHEHLESFNQPLYFYEFMERATAHNLQFVAETRCATLAERLDPAALQTIREFAEDWISYEQYLDFFYQRTFRRSILTHQGVQVTRPPSITSLQRLLFSAAIAPESEDFDLAPGVTISFQTGDRGMQTDHPAAKALALVLFQHSPAAVPYAQLVEEVRQRVSAWPEAADDLPELIMRMALSGLIQIQASPSRFRVDVSDKPIASPIARMQADKAVVTNMQHRSILLEELDRSVIKLLDGSRRRDDLVQDLLAQVLDGSITLQADGKNLEDPQQVRECIMQSLPESLLRLAGSGVLVG